MYERFISSSMLTGILEKAMSVMVLDAVLRVLGGSGAGCEHPLAQMSRFFTSSALSSMNLRRGSTWSPMSVVNIRSASM